MNDKTTHHCPDPARYDRGECCGNCPAIDSLKASYSGHAESVQMIHRDLDRAYQMGRDSLREALNDLLACVDHEGDPDWDWAINRARAALGDDYEQDALNAR